MNLHDFDIRTWEMLKAHAPEAAEKYKREYDAWVLSLPSHTNWPRPWVMVDAPAVEVAQVAQVAEVQVVAETPAVEQAVEVAEASETSEVSDTSEETSAETSERDELHRQFEEKFQRPVPNVKKNDLEWIRAKIAEIAEIEQAE